MSFIRGSASGQTTPSLSDSGSSTEEVKTTREPPLKKERLFLSGSTSSSESRTNSFRSAQTKDVKELPPKFPIEKRFVLVYREDLSHLFEMKNQVKEKRLLKENVFILDREDGLLEIMDIDGKIVTEPLKDKLDEHSKLTIVGHGNEYIIGGEDDPPRVVEALVQCGVNKPIALLKLNGCSNGVRGRRFLENLQKTLLGRDIQVGFCSGKEGPFGTFEPLKHKNLHYHSTKRYKNFHSKLFAHMGMSPSIRERPTTKKILRSAVLGTAHLLTGGISIIPTVAVVARKRRAIKNKVKDWVKTYEESERAGIKKFGHSVVAIKTGQPNFKETTVYAKGLKGDRPIFHPGLIKGGEAPGIVEVPARHATRVVRNRNVTGIEPTIKYSSPPGYKAWKEAVERFLECSETGKEFKDSKEFRLYLAQINFLHFNKKNICATLTAKDHQDPQPKILLQYHKKFLNFLDNCKAPYDRKEVKGLREQTQTLIDHVLTEYEAAQKELLGEFYNKAT